MKILTAKYFKGQSETPISITLTTDRGTNISVPIAEGNTEYQEILKWVAQGNKIEEAD
jgi:hypothetical protein|tara:strand:- start:227 stop:400 length:174 start_codon:yes stop_codon:yes gene_type:complete